MNQPMASPTAPDQHPADAGWLVVTGLAAVLILAIGGCTAQPATSSPRTTQTQPPADPQVADAIQQVIQRANAEQAQAIASNDPSVMSDTATGSYYSQLRQTYRNLLAQGATSIQLTSLTWGAITADDSAATANTLETWVTTSSDDTTDQSTDANVYSLVNQSGTWLIQDDQQPTTCGHPRRLGHRVNR